MVRHSSILGGEILTLLLAALLAGCSQSSSNSGTRQRISINSDWRFTRDDPADAGDQLQYPKMREFMLGQREGNPGAQVSYVQPSFDDGKWRRLDLPHDWAIEGPFKQEFDGPTGRLNCWGVGWYRRRLDIPESDRGKQVYLDLDGAMSFPNVWLNGQYVGGWAYGYTSFRLDLTPQMKPGGENVLAIRLDNPPLSSRWYPGAGLYRNVWLVKTAPVHAAHDGMQITTPDHNTVDLKITIENDSHDDVSATARTQLFVIDANDRRVGSAVTSTDSRAVQIASGKTETALLRARIGNPRLWSIESPNRYVAVTTIEQNGRIVDSVQTPFGIRSIKFDPDKAFFLNGQHVVVKGVCEHHDFGALGAAWNQRAMERKLEMLKELGCNAIRTSHNPPAPELLDLCDRMGFLVMDEVFDQWLAPKRDNDYHTLFPDWSEQDLRAFIRRDRNHPSIIMWSMGNEIREQAKPEGRQIATNLTRIVHEEDPTRPATAAVHIIETAYNGFQNIVDVFGFNYSPTEYAKFHQANPTKALIGSETVSTISTRGEYLFPVGEDKRGGKILPQHQMSSYDLYAPSWAVSPDVEFKAQDQNPFVAGMFVWTGFDYLGEPTPWEGADAPSRSSYFGIFDLAGFKKDRYYLFQSHWRPDLPMAHILPHWNWPDRVGQVTPVHVYTSGDEGELFLNGKSQGRKKKDPFQYRLRWDEVKYEPGELKVITWKNGQHWADAIMKTTGAASKLLMQPDRARIRNDGLDLSYISVTIADAEGSMVPRSNNLLKFELSGPGEIVAVDNGDPTSLESFHVTRRNAFNGLCMVIVCGARGEAGQIKLKVVADSLASAEATIGCGN